MDDIEFKRKDMIRQIVESPLFPDMIKTIKSEIANAMLSAEKEDDRDRLFHDAKAITRLEGQLTKIANEVRMTNG
jgi:hypothetical protein